MVRLPISLDRGVAVLEQYLETVGAGHLFRAKLDNLPALVGELMVAGEADPGLIGLNIPFTFGKGTVPDEEQARAIRRRADELWEEWRALAQADPLAAAEKRQRYLRIVDARLAENPRLAVKVLRRGEGDTDEKRSLASRFAREDEALRRLNHRNIVRRYACVSDPRLGPCILMEQVNGKTLEKIWRKRMERGLGPLPLPAVAHIAYQLAHALAYAHSQGVVHGDLRPANLVIEEPTDEEKRAGQKARGLVKVAGFGAGDVEGRDALFYSAPEQVRGLGVTTATDVYQLGITLYVLVTGRYPYEMETPEQLKAMLLAPDPHPGRVHHFRPEISARFEGVIEGARDKDPMKRWTLERVVEAVTQVYGSKSFTLESGPRTSIAEELIERAQTNFTLKDYYRGVEALNLARDFMKSVPVERGGEALQKFDQLSRQYEPNQKAVDLLMLVHRKHIAPVDRVMEELYRRHSRGEPLLKDEEKGVFEGEGEGLVVSRRSLFDWILKHTAEAIRDLSRIDPELVGDMHRKMVDRASSQEIAATDLAQHAVKFGEDFVEKKESPRPPTRRTRPR
jgi:serine/threonine protein kinase